MEFSKEISKMIEIFPLIVAGIQPYVRTYKLFFWGADFKIDKAKLHERKPKGQEPVGLACGPRNNLWSMLLAASCAIEYI